MAEERGANAFAVRPRASAIRFAMAHLDTVSGVVGTRTDTQSKQDRERLGVPVLLLPALQDCGLPLQR